MPSGPTASSIHLTSGPGKPFMAASSSEVSSTTTGRTQLPPRLHRFGAHHFVGIERLDLRQVDALDGERRADDAPRLRGLVGVAGDEDEVGHGGPGFGHAGVQLIDQLGVQSFDLRPELLEAALVPQHVIGVRHPRLGGGLRREPAARRLGVDAALDGAPQPQLGIGLDRDHDVVTVGPAGLDQQRRLHHHDAASRPRGSTGSARRPVGGSRFERAPRRGVGEDQGAELLVIDAAPRRRACRRRRGGAPPRPRVRPAGRDRPPRDRRRPRCSPAPRASAPPSTCRWRGRRSGRRSAGRALGRRPIGVRSRRISSLGMLACRVARGRRRRLAPVLLTLPRPAHNIDGPCAARSLGVRPAPEPRTPRLGIAHRSGVGRRGSQMFRTYSPKLGEIERALVRRRRRRHSARPPVDRRGAPARPASTSRSSRRTSTPATS